MSFSNLLNSVWQNVVAEKMFFIKMVVINALVCSIYLVIPSFVRTFLGALFAKADESTFGIYVFLKENMSSIEKTISLLTAILLTMAYIIAIMTAFSIMNNDMKIYKVFKRTGMSENMVLCHAFVQNALVCACWCVLSFVVARGIALIISMVIKAEVLIPTIYLLILFSAEAVLVMIMSFAKIKMSLFNSRQES